MSDQAATFDQLKLILVRLLDAPGEPDPNTGERCWLWRDDCIDLVQWDDSVGVCFSGSGHEAQRIRGVGLSLSWNLDDEIGEDDEMDIRAFFILLRIPVND